MNSLPIEKLQNKPIIYAFCINAAFALAFLLFFYNNYETNDDQLMLMLLTGAFSGTGTHYIMYVNSILSFPLQLLYAAIPSIHWYPIFQYIVVLVSFTAITYVFIKKDLNRGLIVSILLLCSFGFDFYTQMQFTKVSGCATAAGILLGLHSFFISESRIPKLIPASILVVIGSLFRFNMSLVAIFFSSSLIIFLSYMFIKDKRYKELIFPAMWLLALFSICFILSIANDTIYQKDEKWSAYMDFNVSRSQLLDRSFPNYADNKDLYLSMDISQDDINLYRTWDFGDPDLFSPENVKRMATARISPNINIDFVKSFFSSVLLEYFDYPWILGFLIACVLILYVSRKNIIWLLIQIGLLSTFSFYLFYYERYLKNRVDICIFLASTLVLLFIYMETQERGTTINHKHLILALSLIMLIHFPTYTRYIKDYDNAALLSEEHRSTANIIANDDSHLYLVSLMSSDIWRDSYSIFEPIKPGTMSNVCFLGGCFAFTPEWDRMLERWDISNPYIDCINNESIYILDNKHINSIVAYINRHYDPNAKALPVNVVDGCAIYQIVSE